MDLICYNINVMKKGVLFSILFIIILGFAAYSNSFNGKFIWDDNALIRDNLYLRSWAGAARFFTKDTAAGGTDKLYPYRPIQMLSYAIDYSIWKLNTFGYHLVNVILHILVALSIYWLVGILFKDRLISFLTSVFFAVHPIHTEAVSYISGRADPLAALFMILCVIFYIKISDSKASYYLVPEVICYALALLSRENSLILPLLLLLYHYISGKRIRLKALTPILAITAIYIVIRFTVLKPPAGSLSAATLLQRLPGFFAALAQYLKLTAFPFDLHMEYGPALFSFSHPQVAAGIFLFTVMIASAIANAKNNKLIFFSISWFFITLLPQSNLYPVNAYMAEHWLYLPSMGLFLLFAGGMSRLFKIRELRISAAVFTAMLLGFYTYVTIGQNDYWREPIHFYERTIRFAPDSKSAYSNLAVLYNNMGRKDIAIALYSKALAIDPSAPAPCNNLAKILGEMGRKEDALALFKRAIARNPKYAIAHNNLGNLYSDMGRSDEAIKAYRKALEIDPDMALAYNNLANQYNALGRKAEALELYEKSIAIDPGFAIAYNNMASVYYDTGDKDKARAMLEKAISLDPNLATARKNLEKMDE